MQIGITARHITLTPQMKEYVTKKLEKLRRYSQYIQSVELVLIRDAGLDRAEGKLHLRHDVLTAHAESADIQSSVREVVARLLTQLKRHDERLKERKKIAGHRMAVRARGP